MTYKMYKWIHTMHIVYQDICEITIYNQSEGKILLDCKQDNNMTVNTLLHEYMGKGDNELTIFIAQCIIITTPS